MMSANKAITDENEQYAAEQRERQEQEEERQKARQQHYKDLQSQVNDTYFQRELEAQESIYGDDKLGAIQSQYGMISAKGENDWNTTMRDLGEKSKTLDAYNSQLAEYERKEKNGTLSDKEKQERDKLESKRDNLQSEFDSSYSDAIQKRLATQDELLNLENSMRSAYLDEAQKYVDEESENMREQLEEEAEEENERQEREKQEREAYKEELREAVGGQKAITAGSSEAFDIASKIYSRGQENIPPEKKIEDSTKRIEEYVKAMQEQMMAYYTEQANGLTLRMEY